MTYSGEHIPTSGLCLCYKATRHQRSSMRSKNWVSWDTARVHECVRCGAALSLPLIVSSGKWACSHRQLQADDRDDAQSCADSLAAPQMSCSLAGPDWKPTSIGILQQSSLVSVATLWRGYQQLHSSHLCDLSLRCRHRWLQGADREDAGGGGAAHAAPREVRAAGHRPAQGRALLRPARCVPSASAPDVIRWRAERRSCDSPLD